MGVDKRTLCRENSAKYATVKLSFCIVDVVRWVTLLWAFQLYLCNDQQSFGLYNNSIKFRCRDRQKIIQIYSDIDEGELKSNHENIVNKQNILKELNEKIMDLMSVEEAAEEIQDADELLYMLTVESKFRQIRKLIQISQPATRNLTGSASTSRNPNADSFSPVVNTKSSLTNLTCTHHDYNFTNIHTQPIQFDEIRTDPNGQLQSSSSYFQQGMTFVSNISSQIKTTDYPS